MKTADKDDLRALINYWSAMGLDKKQVVDKCVFMKFKRQTANKYYDSIKQTTK